MSDQTKSTTTKVVGGGNPAPYDKVLKDMVDYVFGYEPKSEIAIKTAKYCFIDAIGCAILSLKFDGCKNMLGPIVEGVEMKKGGVPIPGTNYLLDPSRAAFNIGTMIRWLDYNDTFLAAEWGHPSDNLGTILAITDYISRISDKNFTIKDVLHAMIKAYEIQGVLALENSFNKVGLDHVILVKVASTAVATMLLGGTKEQIFNAVSNAWVDGGVLRTYRHFPNTGSRKSWAAGDQCQRAVFHALNAIKGEMGYPTALSAPGWGFYSVQFQGNEFKMQRPYAEYVMENILFKVSYPAEFHAQTAVECAIKLYDQIKDKKIKKVHMKTHKSAMRIIVKFGALTNYADRDHCLQYMTACGLLFGELTANSYEDDFHNKHLKQIDELREKMDIKEDEQFSKDYLDPEKRSIANAVQVEFEDGSKTEEVKTEYPIGHKRRRSEAFPLIEQKFKNHLSTLFDQDKVKQVYNTCLSDEFLSMKVNDFMDLLKV